MMDENNRDIPETDTKRSQTTTEYCGKLQQWIWQYYWGHASWQSWVALSLAPFPPPYTNSLTPAAPASGSWQQNWSGYPFGPFALSSHPGGAQTDTRSAQQQNGSPPQAGTAQFGREFTVPSPLQRLLAETVDFFILFCVKATVVLWIMYLTGMKDITKFFTNFIVEEIDENTSIEDLQKMMAVALVYRLLVCIYETICIWGAGGATPGKFLLGLRVVTCDTFTMVRPNRVLVVPAANVSLSSSAVRALNKNFSIAFLFPVFITLLFFQHNRTVYDIVAGTIVVQRRGER